MKPLKRLLMLVVMVGTLLLSGVAYAQEMTVGVANLLKYLDPGRDHSNVGSQIYHNTFDSLILKDPTKVEPVFLPGLALSWQMIAPTCMELRLRRDVTFHNGDPMTADDVVFSLARMFNPSYPPYVTRQREYFTNMYRVEKVDDYTVRVFTKRPDPLLEMLLAVQQANIVPKKYLLGLSGHPDVDEVTDYEKFGLAPVGTGPYKITEWRPGERLVWERFEAFWGDKPAVKKVTVRRIPELAARVTGLMTGELDVITNLPPDQVSTVDQGKSTKVVGALTPLFHVVFYNAELPRMSKKIRQALNLAIDRQLLVDTLWNGKAKVPPHHAFPQYGPLYDPTFQNVKYDPERAKQLLQEAGYDGFEITFDTHPTYYTNGLLAAQALKEMWEKVGVKIRIRVDERWTGSDPDMMARNWSNPMYFPDPVGSYGTMWSPSGARITAGTWKPQHPDYEILWDKFRFSLDAKERLALYKEILHIAEDEAPFTILYQPYESYGLRKHVHWQPLPGHIPYVLDFRQGNLRLDAVTAGR